jgi:hypothetical protein
LPLLEGWSVPGIAHRFASVGCGRGDHSTPAECPNSGSLAAQQTTAEPPRYLSRSGLGGASGLPRWGTARTPDSNETCVHRRHRATSHP